MTLHLINDIKIICLRVADFPRLIPETFRQLAGTLPIAGERDFYGIAYTNEAGQLVYKASAGEIIVDEGERLGLETFIIRKGYYEAERVCDWKKRPRAISRAFLRLERKVPLDNAHPFIEWYKSSAEMWCMVRIQNKHFDMKQHWKQELTAATQPLLSLLLSLTPEELNAPPPAGSWTAGQVVQHIYLSDLLLLENLEQADQPTYRDPGEQIEQLRSTFMDFTQKFQAAPEIDPAPGVYFPEQLAALLRNTRTQMQRIIDSTEFNSSGTNARLGTLTRMEMIAFVVYHTQRHLHQLQKITGKDLI